MYLILKRKRGRELKGSVEKVASVVAKPTEQIEPTEPAAKPKGKRYCPFS